MQNWFKDHPASVGESYFQHMGSAFGFAGRLFGAAVACFLHGVFPFLFTRTGSTAVKRLHEDMTSARQRQGGAPSASAARAPPSSVGPTGLAVIKAGSPNAAADSL
jgi:hypothetical protein